MRNVSCISGVFKLYEQVNVITFFLDDMTLAQVVLLIYCAF